MYHFLFFLIRLDHSAHGMVDAALVQLFVRFGLVAVLVTHPDQQQASLSAIDSDLADDLVEALVVQLLPGWTQADFSGLALNEAFVELLAELDDFDFGGRGGEDSLYPELAVVGPVLLGG